MCPFYISIPIRGVPLVPLLPLIKALFPQTKDDILPICKMIRNWRNAEDQDYFVFRYVSVPKCGKGT